MRKFLANFSPLSQSGWGSATAELKHLTSRNQEPKKTKKKKNRYLLGGTCELHLITERTSIAGGLIGTKKKKKRKIREKNNIYEFVRQNLKQKKN